MVRRYVWNLISSSRLESSVRGMRGIGCKLLKRQKKKNLEDLSPENGLREVGVRIRSGDSGYRIKMQVGMGEIRGYFPSIKVGRKREIFGF